MGRETFISVVDKEGNEVFKPEDNIVKGESDVTGTIVAHILTKFINGQKEDNEIQYNISSNEYKELIKELKAFQDKEWNIYDRLEKRYNDLIKCRLNSTNLKDFNDFTEAIQEVEEQIEESNQPAHHILEMLNDCERWIEINRFQILEERLESNSQITNQDLNEAGRVYDKYFIKIKVGE